jgi:hypothetical protein
MIDAVTIGPIPRVKIDPVAPAKKALYCSKMSIESGDNPNTGMLERKKYRSRIPTVHENFDLNGTCCVGLSTLGILSK